MASIADTDSLSGVEPLDSTATSPLLKAAAVSAHPDTISPASQLSSLRASLVQSSTLLKGNDDKPGSNLGDSPEFRLSNVSTLTQSSLEKHNISHHNSGTSVDAVWQDQRLYPGCQVDGKKEAWIKGMSSLPSTPYSSRQHDQQPQRLLATADNKLAYHSQTLRDSGILQEMSRHSHPAVPANRQLFDSQTVKTTSASKERHAHSGREPPPLKASPEGRREFVRHHDRSVDKPEHLSRGMGNSQNAGLLQSFHSADVRQATTMNWSQDSHQDADRSNVNSHEKRHQSHHRDHPPKLRITTSAEKNFSEIQEMEKVRRSLYHMVHNSMGRPSLERDSLESKESIGELLAAENGFTRESFDSARTESLLGPEAYQDVSPLAMDSGLGLSSLRNLGNIHVPALRASSREGTLYAENQMLKDSLEKERYRRKHCEKQIGDVQAKLLETQQQLAVAVSTERKKDAMIEQLDKTLARIVDGWRKQEQDKNEALERLANEKHETAEEMDKLRKALDDHQIELDQAKEKLSSELQQALQLQRDTVSQLVSLQEDHSKVKDQLVAERKLTTQTQHQRDSAVEERHRLDRQIKQVQHMLAEERQQSQTMRKDFQERIEHLEKDHQQLLEKQKAKIAEELKISELLSTRQQEVDKLKAELDNATKDKENMCLELNLQQAKAEAAQQKLEAEWQEKLERLVDDRMRELQLQSSQTEAELRESHRKQLSELHDHHQSQLLSQRSSHVQDLAQRDKKIQDLTQEYKTRLEQHHQDMAQMTQRLKKAQQQRSALVQRLQGVQVYCTDVLSQVTSASPLIKELSSGMEAAKGASHMPERTQDTRPQDNRPGDSPITISVSPPKRGVGVGAGNLDDHKQEHEGGDGQEDDTFHLPNLSLATSTASQSPPFSNLFSFLPDTALKSNPGDSVFPKHDAVSMSEFFNIPAVQDTTDDGFSLLSNGKVPESGIQIQGDSFVSFKTSNRMENHAKSVFHGKPQQPQGFQSVSAPIPDATTALAESWREPSIMKDLFANTLKTHPEYPSSTLQQKQRPAQGVQLLSGSRTNAAPAKEPSKKKETVNPSSGEHIPSQDLIPEGLRMLEMSPPSGHSSPLRDPPSGLAGLTLGDILRATGGGWDGLREGTRQGGQEEFGEFREILPSLDDTKTTNSMAAYPSEDETVSELESGPINPDSSNILLERLAEHGHRQMALQHYIQMLLQQPPRAATEEVTTSGTAVTKETVNITNKKQGMTTWQEQAPQSHKRGPTSTRNPNTNPKTSQLTHTQGSTQQGQRSKASSVGGSTGPRQTTDKQGSSAKTKGPTGSQPQNRTTRPAQRAAPATKPNRQATASSTTGHKKVVRKAAVRN
ncbi:uncharacterized protein LOC119723467 [Patiria miniata]|uniref:Centrobin n=1 Tax=Patiria miniata TaxID=46514 RepID=A0A913ZE49_PATMI|nr:uncharacterized protein LOC119723467 [Patiria miniata]XP_038050062.1 uncharacterized protein LOC119723467 [Patiria miniata]